MESRTSRINSTTLNYTVLGPLAGAPVVAFPGLFTDRTALHLIATVLAAQGRRVYLVDHRGQGENTRASRSELSLPALAEDAAAFIAQLRSGRVDVIGAGQGSMVALWLLAHYRDLLRSVTVAGASAEIESRRTELEPLVAHRSEHGARHGLATIDGPVDIVDILARRVFGEWTRRHHPLLVEHWQQRFTTLGRGAGAAAHGLITRPPLPDLIGTGVPVLALVGTQDTVYSEPESGAGVAKATSGRAIPVACAGNSPLTEQPDIVAPHLLGFLSERAA